MMVIVVGFTEGQEAKSADIVALCAVAFIMEITVPLIMRIPPHGPMAENGNTDPTAYGPGDLAGATDKKET